MISQKKLQSIGFSEKGAKVYSAMLQLGDARVSDIAKTAEINRTTTYSLLQDFLRRGIVNMSQQRGVKIFWIEDVQQLKEEMHEKERSLDSLLPELLASQMFGSTGPKITTFEGRGGVRDLFQRILDRTHSGETIREYIGSTDFYERFPTVVSEYFPEERVKRRIPIKILSLETEEAKRWKSEKEKYLREVRFLPKHMELDFAAILHIFPGGVAMMSYRETFTGVLIEQKEIADMLTLLYDFSWSAARSDI